MQSINPRFRNVLVMTPASCASYGHTRALRKRCDNVFEFNFIETYKCLGIVETRRLIARIVLEKKIDVFFITFYGDSYLVSPEFLRVLKKNVRIVLVCHDDESAFDAHSKHYAQAVDAVVTTDYFSIAAYRELGVPAVLCLTSVSKEMCPALELTRDIDVSFVGNCRKTDRKQYLDFLSANGVKVESFGFGSPHGFISDSEMGRIFCRSKINLNFSRLENPAADRLAGHKGRTIEAAMTRSFCLSEYYPALPYIFEIKKEIDCFSDRHSLLERVRYYLSHEEERRQIAAQACARALREYEEGPCFDRVVRELSAIFSGAQRGAFQPSVLRQSQELKTRQISDLIVHGLSLLVRGRLGVCVEMVPELLQYGPWVFLAGVVGGGARAFDILRRKLRYTRETI